MAQDDYAVVVGIATYPSLGDLQGPERDALDFRDWLTDKAGGAVPIENVRLIQSSDFDTPNSVVSAQPTTQQIERAFDEIFLEAEDAGGRAGRRLYVYLAGHGSSPELRATVLFMANAARGTTGHHVGGPQYADYFRQAGFFDEVVLFMDCCRTSYTAIRPNPVHYDQVTANQDSPFFYGFASRWNKAAREGPWGQNGDMRGLFTLALLSALRTGANVPAGQPVRCEDIERYVYNYVRSHPAWGNIGQEPTDPEFSYDKLRQITFGVGLAAAQAPLYHVVVTTNGGAPPATVELLDGALKPITPTSKQGGTWEWNVPSGLYLARADAGREQPIQALGQARRIDVTL
jgi:hypothetical protein